MRKHILNVDINRVEQLGTTAGESLKSNKQAFPA